MPELIRRSEELYSTWTGLIYIFNLIVGTGALTLPAVFGKSGWMLGLVVVCILAVVSFVTATFVIETMASANALVQWNRWQCLKKNLQAHEPHDASADATAEDEDEDTPLVSPVTNDKLPTQPHRYYVLDEKIEMGEMASLFFNKVGRTLFFLCFVIYLYGDLSIYSAAVAKSLADVSCTYQPANFSCNSTLSDTMLCWEDTRLTRHDAYHMFLGVFIVSMGPFVFSNIQKTKYLQMFTSVMRWIAFTVMIVYAVHKLIVDGPKGHPLPADISGIPALFGACVYSFMCHHSLPALVSPIANKSKLTQSLVLDYFLIAVFYLLLALTGVFAFDHVDDLYTLDFGPRNSGDCSTKDAGIAMKGIEYFLALFPVFTLSTNFPIIAITLRNNLKSLFLTEGRHYKWYVRKVAFPLLAVVPSVLIAMATEDLKILVGITGSYAGAGIQYLIPAFLVVCARKKTLQIIGMGVRNEFASPFSSKIWVIVVILWALACIILVSVNFITVWIRSEK